MTAASLALSGCARLADGAASVTAPQPERQLSAVQPPRMVIVCSMRSSAADSALYVVDGRRMSRWDFAVATSSGAGSSALRADDIENIEVLKGPAAAKLYGATGAHGVIIITTKRGAATATPGPAPATSKRGS